MNWKMFNNQYIVEVVAKSYVDIKFDINTPLQPTKNIRLEEIDKATVLERKTGRVVKEYNVSLDSFSIRSTQNHLREQIEKDFNIKERRLSPFELELCKFYFEEKVV